MTLNKFVIDGMDKSILRVLYKNGALVGSKIAKNVGLSSSAISLRLNNLMNQGIIKQEKVFGIRKFKRVINGKKVSFESPRSIFWNLDLVHKK